jgi:hypothetical protein
MKLQTTKPTLTRESAAAALPAFFAASILDRYRLQATCKK